ncbi:hypothetical protein BDB00DRAFT_807151 [Zychaea mexicana]|uniref:uncharacterized protein n=1 Tax=Zychaea mexicana TaxID=64656 RepID=UPI0022FE7333|nr:uncharacterized protein BDB00DRAFT_807151 [Zychaea mexicana]KAI9496793.1 hypothetical protein BDB00DRAFT_807151 [Zychaea mexicana]
MSSSSRNKQVNRKPETDDPRRKQIVMACFQEMQEERKRIAAHQGIEQPATTIFSDTDLKIFVCISFLFFPLPL